MIKLFLATCFTLLFTFNLHAEYDCTLGLLLPLTAEYASIGKECQMGYQVAQKLQTDPNLKIKYVTGDTRAIPKESINEFKNMTGTYDIDAFLFIRSGVGMAINPLSMSKKIPILGAVGHKDFVDQNPYAFRFWPSVTHESKALADLAKKNGHTKVALLTTEDDWLLSYGDAFKINHRNNGGVITYEETLTPEYSVFNTILTKVKASKPDAVFFNLGVNHLSVIIKQARELGLEQKIYGGYFLRSEDVLKGVNPQALEGITFIELQSSPPKFLETYYELFPDATPPSGATYTCYTEAEAAHLACEKKKKDQQNFYTTLTTLAQFPVADGSVELKNREAQYALQAYQFKDGKVESLN